MYVAPPTNANIVSTGQQTTLFHFVEREYLAMVGPGADSPNAYPAVERLARFAVLFSSGPVVVPAPGLFETTLGYELARGFAPAIEREDIRFLGGASDPWAFVERKQEHFPQHGGDGYQVPSEQRIGVADASWRVKRVSTDIDLLAGWHAAFESRVHPLLALALRAPNPVVAEAALYDLPFRLEGQAIIASHLIDAMPAALRRRLTAWDITALRFHLASSFYTSYSRDAGLVLDAPRLPDADALMPTHLARISTLRLERMLQMVRLDTLLLDEISIGQMIELANRSQWRAFASEVLWRSQCGREWNAAEVVALSRVRMRSRPLTVVSRRPVDRTFTYLVELLRALGRVERLPGTGRTRGVSIDHATIETLVNIENLHLSDGTTPTDRTVAATSERSEPEYATEGQEDPL